MSTLLALTGYKRSGKDTVADALIIHRGFSRVAFADPVKQLASRVYYQVTRRDSLHQLPKELARPWYVGIGEGARGVLGERVWLDKALDQVEAFREQGIPVVITDLRYPNEAEAIKEAGGYIWRVQRDSVRYDANDPAEAYIDYIEERWADYVLVSPDLEISDLHQRVLTVHDSFFGVPSDL